MRRFFLSLCGFAALLIPLVAADPAPKVCDDGKEFTKVDPVKDGPKAKDDDKELGRAKPQKQYDYGNFRAVVGSDGKTRYFPRLSKHVDHAKRAVPLPATVDWSKNAANVTKRMYLNNKYGCCVWSSRYHQWGYMTASDAGKGEEGTDDEVYAVYQAACGRGDNGCDMSAVNEYQRTVGFRVGGVLRKTDGSVAVDNTNKELAKAAIYYMGGINVGMSLPNDWYQSADKADWGITNSQIVGGHEVQAFGYDEKGVWISTWAGTRRILWEAWLSTRWLDECYVTLSSAWYGADGIAPGGFNVDTLKADLALIAAGKVPPLPEPTPPPAPPGPAPVVGGPLNGRIVIVETYVDGVLKGTTKSYIPAGSSSSEEFEKELKSAGIDPLVVLADLAKLRADIKAKAGFIVIMADLMKLAADLGLLVSEPAPMPKEKTGLAPFGECWHAGADRIPWVRGVAVRRDTGEFVLAP